MQVIANSLSEIQNQDPIYSKSVYKIELRQPRNLDEDNVNIVPEEKAPLLQKEQENLWAKPFPYKYGRLKKQDYKKIISDGVPFNDPQFPHGPKALFIDDVKHQHHDKWRYEKDSRFYWRRASDHFKDKHLKVEVFDGIDPTDIIQGKIADCYFLAALAGLAEDLDGGKNGLRIRDNFLVQKANDAGCYAVNFTVDGEDLEVVVDDWFPFYIDIQGNEKFCFAQSKPSDPTKGVGEIWVQIIEKAWAKVCGSYEAAEMGTAAEAFNNIDGTPSQNFFMQDIQKNNEEKYLWDLLKEADQQKYVITCSIDSNVRCNPKQLKDFGLCDHHSYTVLQCVEAKLFPQGEKVRYLMQLRNPWGKREWKGPWSDYSSCWEQYPFVHETLRMSSDKSQKPKTSTGTLGAADDGRFWILYKDFFQFFYSVTVGYTRDDFYHVKISDQIPDNIPDQWGLARLRIPQDVDVAFLSLFQLNYKFFDQQEDKSENKENKSDVLDFKGNIEEQKQEKSQDAFRDKCEGILSDKVYKYRVERGMNEEINYDEEAKQFHKDFLQSSDLQYPQIYLIICRKGVLQPQDGQPLQEEQIVYIDGTDGEEPNLTLRLTNMKKGEYYILYKAIYPKDKKILSKRLNLVFYSRFMQKRSEEELEERQKHLESELPSNLLKPISRELSRGNKSQQSRKSQMNFPLEYEPMYAIEFERLEQSSFKKEFYEDIEQINYGRYIDAMNEKKFEPPKFVDDQLN